MLVTFPERDLCVDLHAIKSYRIHRLEKPEFWGAGDPEGNLSHFVTANGNIGNNLQDQVTLYNGMKQECRDFIHDIKLFTEFYEWKTISTQFEGDTIIHEYVKVLEFTTDAKDRQITNTYGSPMKIKPWLSDNLRVVDDGYVDPEEVFQKFQASEYAVEDLHSDVFHYYVREWRGTALYDRGGTYDNLEWIKQLDFTEEVKPTNET